MLTQKKTSVVVGCKMHRIVWLVAAWGMAVLPGCDDGAQSGMVVSQANGIDSSQLNASELKDEILEAIESSRVAVTACADTFRQGNQVWQKPKLSLFAELILESHDGVGSIDRMVVDWPTEVPETTRACITAAFLASSFRTQRDDFRGAIQHPFCLRAPVLKQEGEAPTSGI